jgi:hypothetical protein
MCIISLRLFWDVRPHKVVVTSVSEYVELRYRERDYRDRGPEGSG